MSSRYNIIGTFLEVTEDASTYSTSSFFFFFFLSRRMSAREEPSILLLSRGGKDERAIATRTYFALNVPLIREVDVSTSN